MHTAVACKTNSKPRGQVSGVFILLSKIYQINDIASNRQYDIISLDILSVYPALFILMGEIL